MAGAICRSRPPLALKSVPSLQTKSLIGKVIFTLRPPKFSLNTTSTTLQITSYMNNNNLVFEDRSNGVICYRDDDGEIICEGYDDEEPRIIEKLPCGNSCLSFGSDGELKIDRLECFETVNGGSGNGSGSGRGRGDLLIRANGFSS